MTLECALCGIPIVPNSVRRNITSAICDSCILQVSGTSIYSALLEAIDAPILLMEGNPRQVITANQKALTLFDKKSEEVENHRGGQVFNCVHSFTEAGCGKDANCENCKIKNSIVDTFTSSTSHSSISTELLIMKAADTRSYVLQISTEKLGDLALVRVERYIADAKPDS